MILICSLKSARQRLRLANALRETPRALILVPNETKALLFVCCKHFALRPQKRVLSGFYWPQRWPFVIVSWLIETISRSVLSGGGRTAPFPTWGCYGIAAGNEFVCRLCGRGGGGATFVQVEAATLAHEHFIDLPVVVFLFVFLFFVRFFYFYESGQRFVLHYFRSYPTPNPPHPNTAHK